MPIEPRNLRELMKTGYCVIDNFIHDESVAKKMREEMCSMPIRYENEEEEEGGEKDALHATEPDALYGREE